MNRKAGLLVLAGLIAALSGCSATKTTSSIGALTPDQQAVQTVVTSAPTIVDDGMFDATTPTGFTARGQVGTLSGVGGESTPPPDGGTTVERRFWRTVTSATFDRPTIDITRDDLGRPVSAHVTISKHFVGTFHVQYPSSVQGTTGDSLVVVRVDKPLRDHWTRQLWLTYSENHWHITATSGAEVTSEIEDDNPQPAIQSIRIQVGESDTTITDVSSATAFTSLTHVPGGTPVTVTVTTSHPDDVVLFMTKDGRARLTPNGDNTYTGTWDTSSDSGLKHFGVNALAHGTVYDDRGTYHSHAWLLPYVNDGDAVAAQTP